MQLPYAAESDTIRRANVALRGAVDPSSGRLQVKFPLRDNDYLVRRVVLQGPASTVARLYTGDPGDLLNLADATSDGASDVADNVQPLYVPAGVQLYVVWTNAAGDTPTDPEGVTMARIELEEVR